MSQKAGTTEQLTEKELFHRWGSRWQRFIDDFDSDVASDTVAEVLRDKIKNGNAERAIAGGHEGREVLELLQNARDAIPSGTDGGRVYIGVYEEGVLVANTGEPFDLFDTDVEDAVTMIGESAKEQSDDEIGHKGVGLKSILSTGEAFEIWSRHSAATDEILRVRLSRAPITAALLRSLGYDADPATYQEAIRSEEIQSLCTATPAPLREAPLDAEAREAIGKLPLFDFPTPLSPTSTEQDSVEDRASSLITATDEWYGEPFRTAVFIDYEDDIWRDLLSDFDIPHPDEPERAVSERADALWSYLSSEFTDQGLTAETLIQFGGIGTLLLERVEADGTKFRERWEVNRSAEALDSVPISQEIVEVSITPENNDTTTKSFDAFQFEKQPADVQLLVPRFTGGETGPPRYPLYLYYPIENTRDIALPYSLHGHFIVETNRKDLSLNSLEANQATLRDGIDLIGAVAEAAAEEQLDDQYPWILLPPVPEQYPEEPNTQTNILRWFQGKVFEELQQRACIPTTPTDRESQSDVRLPDETLLHWNSTIRGGFRALYDIIEEITGEGNPQTPVGTDSFRFPTEATLTGCHQFPVDWDERIERLLTVEDSEAFSVAVAEAWTGVLSGTLSKDAIETDTPHVTCAATAARRLFNGTVEAILETGQENETIQTTLSDLAPKLESVFLLPCRHTDSDGSGNEVYGSIASAGSDAETDTLLLTMIESREGTQSSKRGPRRSRSVIWDVDAPDRDEEPPAVPRETSSYRVYFLDQVTEQDERARRLLELAGRPWGVRRYDGTPSYFRELLDTFATPESARVKPLDFHFLASQIDRLGGQSEDLQTNEGAFLPIEYLESAVKTTDGDRRQNLRRRVDIRNSELSLPRDGGTYAFDSAVLSDRWQRLRETANNDDDAVDEWGQFDEGAYPTWPAPDTDPWVPIAQTINSESPYQRIAQTLSLLGSSAFPGLRCVWMYGTAHPRPRRSTAWDPTEWEATDYQDVETIPSPAQALQATLADTTAYTEWIKAPGRHPQDTAEHSSKCNVKTDGVMQDVHLAAWVWLSDMKPLRELGGERLCELLRRYDANLQGSLLETGWTCSHGHQRDGYGWHTRVPTVLNWQLRHLPVWEEFLTIDSKMKSQWGDDVARLSFAVRKTGSQGARPARLFPHIESDQQPVSTELLETLGVKPIDAFDETEATWHLQRLLEVLTPTQLPENDPGADTAGASLQDPVKFSVADDRLNDWNAAYTDLLGPVLQSLPESDATIDNLDNPFLTHLPIKYEGEWAAASLSWIEANAEAGRYFEDQSPKPWERRKIEQGDYWLLPQTRSGPYSRLTDALGIDRVEASKPVFNADELTFTDDSADDLRSQLQDRKALLIASLEQSSEERIREFAQELEQATAELRIAEEFPEGSKRDGLIDPASSLYAPRADDEAFVLNAAAFDGAPTLDRLAMGVGLLAEQPTKVPVFREVLSPDFTTSELEKRWRQSFPLTTVERILGTQRRQQLRRQLTALTALLDRVDPAVDVDVNVDTLLEEIENNGDNTFDAFTESLRTGDVQSLEGTDASRQTRYIEHVNSTLPSELLFILDRLFGTVQTPWPTLVEDASIDGSVENTVISWLAANASALDAASCFPQSVLAIYSRTLDVLDVLNRTDTEELSELDVWQTRLNALSINRTVDWTTTLPDRLLPDGATNPRLFHFTPAQQYQSTVVTPFLNEVTSDLPDDSPDFSATLRQYITTGEFPASPASPSAANHQDNALTALHHNPEATFTSSQLISPEFEASTGSVRTTGTGGGGGSSQYRGRGQQAEAATLVAILNDTATWLKDEPIGQIRLLRSLFRRLRQNEKETSQKYMWHLESVWEDQLLPLLDTNRLTRESVIEWRTQIDDGQRLRDHPLVALCNVALEHGPGFDVIDPFGTLDGSREQPAAERAAPVEVKAIGGTTPPFDFRLTTNEYKRAKAFARANDGRYIIRLVYVPAVGQTDWSKDIEFVSELNLETVDQVEALVHDSPFEEIVKGGYMNMRINN
jgi:hypothetical protein